MFQRLVPLARMLGKLSELCSRSLCLRSVASHGFSHRGGGLCHWHRRIVITRGPRQISNKHHVSVDGLRFRGHAVWIDFRVSLAIRLSEVQLGPNSFIHSLYLEQEKSEKM